MAEAGAAGEAGEAGTDGRLAVLDEPFDWRLYAAVGLGFFAVFLGLDAAGVEDRLVVGAATAAMFVLLGGLCLRNFAACGTTHCSVTGPGYLAVGALALLIAVGAVALSLDVVWVAFVAVLAFGFGYEAWTDRRRTGAAET